jgi:hypothetical protein
MRFFLFLIVSVPLFLGWLLYHMLVKKDFEKIKNDAVVGGMFLSLACLIFYFIA